MSDGYDAAGSGDKMIMICDRRHSKTWPLLESQVHRRDSKEEIIVREPEYSNAKEFMSAEFNLSDIPPLPT